MSNRAFLIDMDMSEKIKVTSAKTQYVKTTEKMEEQQQQQPHIHPAVLNSIARHRLRSHRMERHRLYVEGFYDGVRAVCMDRRSLQYLVNFLENHHRHEQVVITELKLHLIKLISDPSPDGRLDVLRNFFARSDTMLTKIIFDCCRFGEEQVALQFLSALYMNQTIMVLSIQIINTLQGAMLGNTLSGLMQNIPQLQRLE
jgi:hypothetical protein